jgi:hypothetical protein
MVEGIRVSSIFQLPREIRQQIYAYVIAAVDEVRLHRIQTWSETAQGTEPSHLLSSPSISLAEANWHARYEISDFLERSAIPIVARVHNFNFDHVISYLETSTAGLAQHTVRSDGIVPRRLVIELCGQYNKHWRENLDRWVDAITKLLPIDEAEFGGLHKVVSTNESSLFRVPGHVRIMRVVQLMWLQQLRGAARLALEKIFWTFYGRWRAGSLTTWVLELDPESREWDLMSARGKLPTLPK